MEPTFPYQASDHWNRIVDLNPGEVRALILRAEVRHEYGDDEGAIEDFTTALLLTPRNAPLIGARAGLYHLTGDIRTAVTEYERCLELDPDNAVALANLALALSTCSDSTVRDGRRALDLALRACACVSESKDWALAALAAAYAELGDFLRAVEAQDQALSLPLAGSGTKHAKPEHLECYRNGKPRRDP